MAALPENGARFFAVPAKVKALGETPDFLALVKHGLERAVNLGEQVFGVLRTPEQLRTLQPSEEFGLSDVRRWTPSGPWKTR